MEEVNQTKNKNEDDNNLDNANINIYNSNIMSEKNEIMIIQKISDLLTDLCDENTKDFKNEKNPNIKPFLSRFIPTISIKDYLWRLYKYSKISSSTIIIILIYIDRLCNIYKFKLSYFNIHKLILASMIIAIKYNEDEYYSIKFYAKAGGVTKAEMNSLEYNFLSLIKFKLFVSKELFNKYNDYISSADSEEDDCENDNENNENDDDKSNNNEFNDNNINQINSNNNINNINQIIDNNNINNNNFRNK